MNLFKETVYYFSMYRHHVGNRLYAVFSLSFLTSIIEGIGIMMLLPLLMALEIDGDGSEIPVVGEILQNVLEYFGVSGSVTGIIVVIVILFVIKGCVKFAEGAYMSILHANLVQEIKLKLLDAYMSVNYEYHLTKNTGDVVNLLTTQAQSHTSSFYSYKNYITVWITIIVYISSAVMLAPIFAGFAVIAGIVIYFSLKRLNMMVKALSIQKAHEYGIANKFIIQAVQSFKYLVSTNKGNFLTNKIHDSVFRLNKIHKKTGIAASLTDSIREPVGVAVIMLIVVAQISILNSAISPILVALILIHRSMTQIMLLQTSWQAFVGSTGSFELVEDEHKRLNNHIELDGGVDIGPLKGGIFVDNISFSYSVGQEKILENISMVIRPNQTVALVGASGAGKSTLVDMFTGVLKPSEGVIKINDIELREASIKSWRSQIGYVSQETIIFDDTIANNICLWSGGDEDSPELMKEIKKSAKLAHADEFISSLPDGYNTMVGDRGVRLSGGQRQRLFIARELFKKPKLLILDEATSALDSESESKIRDSVDALKGKMTIIMIAHRLASIKSADCIYVMKNGKIVDKGNYEDLIKNKSGIFNKMATLQSLS